MIRLRVCICQAHEPRSLQWAPPCRAPTAHRSWSQDRTAPAPPGWAARSPPRPTSATSTSRSSLRHSAGGPADAVSLLVPVPDDRQRRRYHRRPAPDARVSLQLRGGARRHRVDPRRRADGEGRRAVRRVARAPRPAAAQGSHRDPRGAVAGRRVRHPAGRPHPPPGRVRIQPEAHGLDPRLLALPAPARPRRRSRARPALRHRGVRGRTARRHRPGRAPVGHRPHGHRAIPARAPGVGVRAPRGPLERPLRRVSRHVLRARPRVHTRRRPLHRREHGRSEPGRSPDRRHPRAAARQLGKRPHVAIATRRRGGAPGPRPHGRRRPSLYSDDEW